MGELFGDRLKKIRLDRELSQEQFAKLLNTSKQVISRYETNQRTPKITIAQEYADKLNVPLNDLIDDALPTIAEPKKPKDLIALLEMEDLTFKGSPITDDDKEKIKRALELAFWDAKEKNKRRKD